MEHFGNIPSEEKLEAVKSIMKVGAVFGTFVKFRCEHCQIQSRLIDFVGRFWRGDCNCPCCRKFVLRGLQDDNVHIRCHSCGQYSRKFKWKFPSELDKNRKNEDFYGILCPHCRRPHKISLRKHKMTNITFRASVRRDIEEVLRYCGDVMFDFPLTELDIEQTIDKIIPKVYKNSTINTDFIQIAFIREEPKIIDFFKNYIWTKISNQDSAVVWTGILTR